MVVIKGYLGDCVYQLWMPLATIASYKSSFSFFFPNKSLNDQIWLCRKVGQSQPRVTFWVNLVQLEYSLMSLNVIGHLVPEKKIFKGFYLYGHGGHLNPLTQIPWTNFHFPTKRRLHMQFAFNQPSCFREDDKSTESEASKTKGNKWLWPLVFMKHHLAHCKYQLWCHRLQQLQKIHCLPFSYTKAQVTLL